MRTLKLLVAVFSIFITLPSVAREVSKPKYKFSISIPDKMVAVVDTQKITAEDIYYDTAAGLVLMVSYEQSKLKSVKNYIDCSRKELESVLKTSYDDSTLHLISCNQSPFYPEEVNVVIFDVSVLPDGFDRCVVFFAHHKKIDIQFSFMYNKANAANSMAYIDSVMKTLVLK